MYSAYLGQQSLKHHTIEAYLSALKSVEVHQWASGPIQSTSNALAGMLEESKEPRLGLIPLQRLNCLLHRVHILAPFQNTMGYGYHHQH